MSLRTGAEIITFLQPINKVSGLYGLLALLTGATLTGLQLSMYLYSFATLLSTLYLYKHIRLQSPFESLLLAHMYALGSVVNALYTAFFAIAWFYLLAEHPDDTSVPGAGTIAENAGFTSPKYNVSRVDVLAKPADGLQAGQPERRRRGPGRRRGHRKRRLPERQHHEHLHARGYLYRELHPAET